MDMCDRREAHLLVTRQVEQKVGLHKGFGLWMEEGYVFILEAGKKARW